MEPQQMTDPQTQDWRAFHSAHLERQTKAMEQTRNYVAIFFWLTLIGTMFGALLTVAYS